ncbi:D-2-hydroxyacid dehydrogenase [Xylophilus rhododendri]|uniref:D-2-hydroxyacid dehydrogenase n=2 Tax=Xylophilus rhododendri TaxID=2697032 RepID=A0A857JEH0_9BURK|nr:D-2-hydroxyacid dehydrogenase [Xylophilus rhododendri]
MNEGAPLRILMSAKAQALHGEAVAQVLQGRPHQLVLPGGGDVDIAFVTREVTGLSTKHQVLPATQAFYDSLRAAPSLRWVQLHSAGADRPVFVELKARGVDIATASGANAEVVAQSAVAGLLALARRFPQLMAAQQERRWAPLMGGALPRDLNGQHATIVGWGPIGQHVGRLLTAFGLRISVVRSSASAPGAEPAAVAFESLKELLPATDWLVLACPLSERTRGLVDAEALALLPASAHLVNVARGEIVDEAALIEALQQQRLAGAFLDVFHQEPLPAESPLWSLPNVIATPHSAGFSDGNAARVAAMFLENLGRWAAGEPLLRLAA